MTDGQISDMRILNVQIVTMPHPASPKGVLDLHVF
jgi:hypothetical protein